MSYVSYVYMLIIMGVLTEKYCEHVHAVFSQALRYFQSCFNSTVKRIEGGTVQQATNEMTLLAVVSNLANDKQCLNICKLLLLLCLL
ncbi:MAG: hypothetical protein ACI8RD_001516 [Bacillariaceae sp.]|jgi:hypothetical protein